MTATNADICVFNFSIVYEEDSETLKANAKGLLDSKSLSVIVLTDIAKEASALSPLAVRNLLNLSSLGWTKCYGPRVKIPIAENYPFEDFVYMATLLETAKITAFDPSYQPIEYLRRSTSVCGKRTPENFTTHIPGQLKRFFDTVAESTDPLEKLALAKTFVESKIEQYTKTLEALVKTSYEGIDEKTLSAFTEATQNLITHINEKLDAKSKPPTP